MDPPLSCLFALFDETVAGGFCGPIDPVALARAEAAFSAIAQWPPFPQEQLSTIVEETLDGLVLRLIIYFYGPMLVLSLIAIWLMVGAGWIGWVVGLILTLVVIVILYAFSVFFRISLANFADAIVAELEEVLTQYRAGIVAAVPRLPRAFLAGVCAYVNQEWICPPTESLEIPTDLLDSPDPDSPVEPLIPRPQHLGTELPARNQGCCGGKRMK